MPASCAAWGCTNRRTVDSRSQGITFHGLPKKLEMREQWVAAIRREGISRCKHWVLCSNHFKPEDFDRTGQTVRIRDGVIPSVFDFPPHLKNIVSKRAARPSRKDTSEKSELPTLNTVSESPTEGEQSLAKPCSQETTSETTEMNTDHSYALSPSLKDLKAKLSNALGRVESLEREMRNMKDRERRAKRNFICLLRDLKGKKIKVSKISRA
ncbi:hypothetical protein DNTS_021963 [Danionella cerebrum]|uniref:THAP-type domain-containing protein n=1 Tax=Danionella cerebrum TaxID=2873325 RepID=A0A553QLM1_9TELE|nr:hypothetical protein DNTS_021963 [Danionella translucida]